MVDAVRQVDGILASAPDYWDAAGRGLDPVDNINGLLPACRALPECPKAGELITLGRAGSDRLLEIVCTETIDNARFRNALYLLMYFDSLFAYRTAKEIHKAASDAQRRWLEAACRKILIRCVEYPETGNESLTREIPRNTRRDRLATTQMVVGLAKTLLGTGQRTVNVRDMAVADGITSLDVAVTAAGQGVPISITATDVQLYLHFVEIHGHRAVFTSDGVAHQYEIQGHLFKTEDRGASSRHRSAMDALDAMFTRGRSERITMVAPEVERAAESRRYDMSFKEEDALDPHPDIAEADIIRVANLLVERTVDHRGYFGREDIIRMVGQIGLHAKNGAHLLLDNFRQKIERVGHWRKDASSSRWTRVDTGPQIAPALEGVADIDIPRRSRE